MGNLENSKFFWNGLSLGEPKAHESYFVFSVFSFLVLKFLNALFLLLIALVLLGIGYFVFLSHFPSWF